MHRLSAVVHGDAIVWEEAFGWADQQRRLAAKPTTPYLASVTKVFTGTALALLASEGRIDMNRSVNGYLGSHKVRPALWDEDAITVQRVADHMAGLTTFNLDCDSAAPCSGESVIDRFGVIIRPPGEVFDYSNLGYGILGDVIARASTQRYGEFLRRAVFEPLGMRDCEITADNRRAAVRYVWGTTREVAAPVLGDTSGVTARPGLTYSHGWWIEQDYVGTRSIFASGGTPYGSAILRLVPAEKLAVIVLAKQWIAGRACR